MKKKLMTLMDVHLSVIIILIDGCNGTHTSVIILVIVGGALLGIV